MLTSRIAEFLTFTCNSRCRYVWSRCTFFNVWDVEHVAEL